MTDEQAEIRTEARIIKGKLKRRHLYGFHYLEEMVRNQKQIEVNEMANKGRAGDLEMIEFLLDRNVSMKEIIKEAKRVGTLVREHHEQLHKENHESAHRHHSKRSRHK